MRDLLVATCMQDLVPRPGIKPRPSALGVGSLTHRTPGKSPEGFFIPVAPISPVSRLLQDFCTAVKSTAFSFSLLRTFPSTAWLWKPRQRSQGYQQRLKSHSPTNSGARVNLSKSQFPRLLICKRGIILAIHRAVFGLK